MGEQQPTIESLTDEQWKQVDAICEQWLQLVKGELSPQLEEHVNVLYEICDLKPPKVVLCDSPPACVEAAIRDGIADRKDPPLPYVLYWRWWWSAYCQIAVEVLQLPGLDDAYRIAKATADVHCLLPYEDVAYISQKPVAVHWLGDQLHKVGGKCIEYRDGWGWHALHDIVVEPWMAEEDADDWTVEKVLAVESVDQRREVIARFGIDRLWKKARVLDIDKSDPKNEYQLGELDITGSPRKYLRMENQSLPGFFHVEPVGTQCNTVAEAHLFREQRTEKEVSENGSDYYQHGDVLLWPTKAKVFKPRPIELT